jgi:hypothetical protein
MRQTPSPIGRNLLPGGVIEWRIHDDSRGNLRSETGASERLSRCKHIEGHRPHAVPKPVQSSIGIRQGDKIDIDLDKRDGNGRQARRQSQSGGPHPCAKVDHQLAGRGVARRGQQDGIVAHAMAPPALTQPQPPTEDGIF